MNIRDNRGYALIEILSVFLLISVISAYVVSSGVDINAELAGEAEIVKSHLRYVQYLALSNETNELAIKFSDTNDSYTLLKNNIEDNNLPNENSATHTLQPGLTIILPSNIPVNKTIAFDKWGSPVPNDTYKIIISDGINTKEFEIIKNTGAVL
ncbi:Uncharacterized protein dnl_15940 [Desulfonema limicola]|uniref:Prepilin-type N-terminal cleavage/methylation domain-containing protein n=1 Tax=Desulfonema limicola TaxID=45656 RepID=A0A975GFI4_9BACT|nr:type II secretion system protein [Desulfonema limicola]QTA79331.1 Uncharacterized protein dnl_15940 [Desulfonema limicola]